MHAGTTHQLEPIIEKQIKNTVKVVRFAT